MLDEIFIVKHVEILVGGLGVIASGCFFWATNTRLDRIEAGLRVLDVSPKKKPDDGALKKPDRDTLISVKRFGYLALGLSYAILVMYGLRETKLPFIG
ncbi:MAG: hypothetical protein ACT4NK_07815 [Limnobacter sp.]|uniref:hypothetical protein n=1 Tax=Limnobacter sp. TaxID=2003368 RepID=UPI00403813E1